MKLFKETRSFLHWFFEITSVFFSVRRITTLTIIIVEALSKIFKFLSFLLPFKVILLAGTSSIPSYFLPFIHDQEGRYYWIVGLAVATVMFYVFTLMLDAISNQLSLRGGTEVLNNANEMAIFNNQENLIQRNYSATCQIWANTLFCVTVYVFGFIVIHHFIFFCIFIIIAIEYLLTSLVLRDDCWSFLKKVQVFAKNKMGEYLNTLSSIAFLSGFLIIFINMMWGDKINPLIAIISFIAMRQILTSIVSIVRDSVYLVKNMAHVNALIFRELPFHPREADERQLFHAYFEKSRRKERIEKELKKVRPTFESIDIRWLDSRNNGIRTFEIVPFDNKNGVKDTFQLQVFPPKEIHRLHNEEYLFSHISRADINAPEVVARYTMGPFSCQICACGQCKPVPADQWRKYELEHLFSSWSVQPPSELVQGYIASHPLLHTRFSYSLISQLEVAVDNKDEELSLAKFHNNLPYINNFLKEMPLYVHNLSINNTNLLIGESGKIIVPIWARWGIEPLGAFLPPMAKEKLSEKINNIRENRSDLPGDINEDFFLLVSLCCNLERFIANIQYKDALSSILSINEITNKRMNL